MKHRFVTDRQTDRHDCGIYRASVASRGKNILPQTYIRRPRKDVIQYPLNNTDKRRMRIIVYTVTISTQQPSSASALSHSHCWPAFSVSSSLLWWSSGTVFWFDASLRPLAPRSRALPNYDWRAHSSAFFVRHFGCGCNPHTQHVFCASHVIEWYCTVSYITDLGYTITSTQHCQNFEDNSWKVRVGGAWVKNVPKWKLQSTITSAQQ